MAEAFVISDSVYKIFGPHISALYTRLSNSTPHFPTMNSEKIRYKVVTGGPMPEVAYGATGVLEYLLSISPIPGPTSSTSIYFDPETHTRLEATFAAITEYEDTLVKRLLGYLTSEKLVKRGVRVIGEDTASESRLPTICFVVVNGENGNTMSGKDVVRVFDAKGNVSESPHLVLVEHLRRVL